MNPVYFSNKKGNLTMEVTQEMLNALLSLNDKELSEKFVQIAAVLGMNERTAAANTAKFRNMLSDAGPAELNRLLASLGAERSAEILKAMDGDRH